LAANEKRLLNSVQSSLPVEFEKKSATPALGSFLWQPDCGNGTYRNPIIYADYSDPDVVRVGEDFYLTASSFNCTPGLPILHSTDLVNWTIINHALKNVPHSRYAEVQPGCGVWAPAIRFHDNKFWIFFPTPDEGIYVTTADHPAGKWSEPHLLQAGKGLIDPCPLWDTDGSAYLVHAYAGSRAGVKHQLRVCPMAPDASRLLGEGKIVFRDPEKQPTIEGPKFLKKDGWYYILAPAGGVETGWQLVLRSRNIYGPYECKIVLEQGNTAINGPHQGALVDTAGGEWWFVHFQDAGIYGRITHLQPVKWEDGWPMMGKNRDGIAEPVLHHSKPAASNGHLLAPQTSDEFDSPKLGLQWQWHANHLDHWYDLGARKSWLRLFPQSAVPDKLMQLPNLLLQKFPARAFTVETSLDFSAAQPGEEAGLIVAGESFAALSLERMSSDTQLVLRINGARKVIREKMPDAIQLRVAVADGGRCAFSFVTTAGPVTVDENFQATKGVWIGAKVGLYSMKHLKAAPSGHADFGYFRFI
jgi:beta-xylosidase